MTSKEVIATLKGITNTTEDGEFIHHDEVQS